jgi:hypothetical protein
VKHRIGFEFHARTLRMELSSKGSGIGSLPNPEFVNGERVERRSARESIQTDFTKVVNSGQ